MCRRSIVRAFIILAMFGIVFSALSGVVGATSKPTVKSHLLTISDLPFGWRMDPSPTTSFNLNGAKCLAGLESNDSVKVQRTTVSFIDGSALPALSESLEVGPTMGSLYGEAASALAHCTSLTFTVDSKPVKATIRTLSLPAVGSTSVAYTLDLTIGDVPIQCDIVLFRVQSFLGEVIYVGVGTPTLTTVEAFANEAAAKAKGAAVSAPAIVSIASAPVKVARTTMGKVGYREVGSGPPVVMIMGFAGTMETWDPRFVDELAQDHEVVIFDNSGLGKTEKLPGHLTIDAMANQTSALLGTLGLQRPDVLGWSMGTMIAQALAVLHPTQVGSLVLCAAYPGTGTVEPSNKAISALTSGNSQEALADLFPPNQSTAAKEYEVSTSSYPTSPAASAAVVSAQKTAILKWWHGADEAGQKTSEISVPTLIADGTEDRLDPVVNDRRVVTLIPTARLSLYPDAGHAFLFQDGSAVVSQIESFLHDKSGTGG
jgi:pimeloyl-ACP methyl ester carboxylesterase